MKKIVIVGGGTAGWMTALIAQKSLPHAKITLVESDAVGILGAGEGTTPHFVGMTDYVNIPVSDLIQNTSSTIKQGILFDNWNSRSSSFFHGFNLFQDNLKSNVLNYLTTDFAWPSSSVMNYFLWHRDIDLNKVDFVAMASDENKVLFSKNENIAVNNPIHSFDSYGLFSLHFDAQSIAKFLSRVAQDRGVQRIEGKVNEINLNEFGEIDSVRIESGQKISGDFFFDCTGFARLLSVKKLGAKWVSFKDSLPAKKAMPFFLDIDPNNIPPYTLARAMSKGWIWKIPLQHRYGCGYVYDPERISDDEVHQEISEFVGFDVEIPRTFNFEPGYVSEPWTKNCLAVGLSNGFVEPLEATSIFQNLIMLEKFFAEKHKIFSRDTQYKKYFNEDISKDHESIAAFIYLHYITDKKNNNFWKNFTKDYKMPHSLERVVYRLQNGIIDDTEGSSMFNIDSMLLVAIGNRMLDRKNVSNIYDTSIKHLMLEDHVNKIRASRKNFLDNLVSHSDFLHTMGANFEKQ